ncbi:DUF3048 domain-containing protein [Candidatus Saccharibacteria bacterium]|nr:DUF3048 domain-containing protein [Candidatus Saccharibacteria bacterium]
MQGDIQQPSPYKYRPPEKPKHIGHHPQPEPASVNEGSFFNLNPSEIVEHLSPAHEDKPESKSKKQRRVLVAPHKHFVRFWRWWLGLSRNERFAFISVALLLFGVVSVLWFAFVRPASAPAIEITKHAKKLPPAPTTVASPLTGAQVDPALAARPVTAIMIENSIYARPQSGLQEAGVVVEAVAEGGITRFLALFQENTPQYIGPVRSLRPYYIHFAAPFQASIAHVGGSPEALSTVRNGNYRDLDQFFNAGSYARVSSREAPHNVYTSFAKLDALNQAKGYTTSTYTIWPRKADKKLAVPTAKTIDIKISSAEYYSHYDYDAATNLYNRSEGGKPHLELVSSDNVPGVQIRPKVVIALVMPYSIAADGQHSVYGDTGTGTAYVFQDGGVTQGTWSKADSGSQIQFSDGASAPLKLNTGQVWMTLVADTAKVTYAP